MKIVSLNTWLLETPWVGLNLSKDLSQRFKKLPFELLKQNADIIFLQEVWKKRFKRSLTKALESHGYYSDFQSHKWMTNMDHGLMIFSRFPIVHKEILSFKETTRFDEKFVKKGALHIVIKHPELGEVSLYNTHLGAMSFENDSYHSDHLERHRRQRKKLMDFISSSHQNRPFLLGADLNISPTIQDGPREDYREFIETLFLEDTWDYKNHHGHTYSLSNPYVGSGTNSSFKVSEKIDYIFFSKNSPFKTQRSELVFNKPLDSGHFLSDHFGLFSELTW